MIQLKILGTLMINDDVVDSLREILDFYKKTNDENSAINREIRMWRERYLNEYIENKYKNKNLEKPKDQYIRAVFLATTSEEMMRFSIEKKMDIFTSICEKI